MTINEITGVIVDAAMKVHTALGAGLLESAYEACLKYELIIAVSERTSRQYKS